jgi:hypothetical protein
MARTLNDCFSTCERPLGANLADWFGSFAHCRIFESSRPAAILLTSLVEILQRPLAPNSVLLDEFSERRLTKYSGQVGQKIANGEFGWTTVYRSSRMQTLTPTSAIGEHLRLSAANWRHSAATRRYLESSHTPAKRETRRTA